MHAQLTNVTFYAADISRLRNFYSQVLGLPTRFEEGDHIVCVSAAPGLTICAHDTTEGPAGAAELIFAADDHATYEHRARSLGFDARSGRFSTGESRLDLVDPSGTLVRLQPSSVRDADELVRSFLQCAVDLGYTRERLKELINEAA